jgi:transglutaminase-like putative cysteine protease
MVSGAQIRAWRAQVRAWQAKPRPQAEESIALRVLVQVLVAIGIIATDIAANTQTSWWAVPISFGGAYWSWRQRRRRNLGAQMVIALGMLVALAVFFRALLGNLGDTRLALAGLLIHLQVLHSFDLPRRKDLGYSMLIGLILLGVAGTLSQTMMFAPVLVAFLAVALPMLILDYRSRLGLAPGDREWQGLGQLVQPGQMARLLGVVAVLGLVVFALLPRFPGYQLRQFPVAAPPNLADQAFDQEDRSGDIRNPGYGIDGRAIGGGTGGSGRGQTDNTFYYGFSSTIDQTLQGQLKPKLVMRVRSQSPGFWRVLGFDRYTGRGWQISRDQQVQNLSRPGWSYRFIIPPEAASAAETKDVVQSFTVLSTLPNLVPSLSRPSELFFPTRQVAIDPEGAIRSPRVLDEGLTYSVISQVPYRDRTRLRRTGDRYPKRIRNHYLEVPPTIKDKLRARAEALLAKAPNARSDAYERSLFLAQALKQTYQIQPDLPPPSATEDLVDAFLFKYNGGYPDHFPTTLAMMLRSLGIPARLAVGFAPGKFNPFTGLYEVYNTDAHAITEVYFPGYGWFAFDPIPGHPLIPPSIERNETFSTLEKIWSWVAGWLPAPLRSWLDGVFGAIAGRLMEAAAWLLGLLASGWIGIMGAIALALLAGGLLWLLILGWQAWQRRRKLAGLAPIAALYQEITDWLAEDCPRHPWQTPLEYAAAYEQAIAQLGGGPGATDRLALLQRVALSYSAWRYGDRPVDVAVLRDQWQQVRRRDRSRAGGLARLPALLARQARSGAKLLGRN